MGINDLEKAEKDRVAVRLAHVVRGDLLVAHSILIQATKLLVEAQHRLNGTMLSLLALEECAERKEDGLCKDEVNINEQ
jgi:hypothetical protein